MDDTILLIIPNPPLLEHIFEYGNYVLRSEYVCVCILNLANVISSLQ